METLTLQVIPYTTRLEEVIWGSGLMAISLMIHGFGMLATLHICNRFKERFGAPDSFMWGMASIILGSWLIAFFEYCLQVPANRYGHGQFTAPQLKIMQEVITLVVFGFFSVLFLKEKLRWNEIAGTGGGPITARRRAARA